MKKMLDINQIIAEGLAKPRSTIKKCLECGQDIYFVFGNFCDKKCIDKYYKKEDKV